jgi:hypothetical protein
MNSRSRRSLRSLRRPVDVAAVADVQPLVLDAREQLEARAPIVSSATLALLVDDDVHAGVIAA